MSYIKHFDDCPTYEQEAEGNVEYRTLLPRGDLANLAIEAVTLEGPAETIYNSHEEWDQVYVIWSGKGKVRINDEVFPVAAPSIVRIPKNTRHGVILSPGDHMRYIYINAYDTTQGKE